MSLSYDGALRSLWSQSSQHPFDRTTPNAGKFAFEFGAPELPLLENVISSVLLQLSDRAVSHPSQQTASQQQSSPAQITAA